MAGDEERNLADWFWTVAGGLRRLSVDSLTPWEISPSQARALLVLARHGSVRLNVLAEHLRIAPRSVTEVVDLLCERGLLRRLPDPSDRRATLVELTDEGVDLCAAVRSARVAGSERVFAGLNAADRAELERILRMLAEQLPRRRRGHEGKDGV